MMTDPRDLASLLATTSPTASTGVGTPTELGFHQGTVLEWNSITHASVINVAGSLIKDMGIVVTGESLLLLPGDTVGIIRFRSTYFLLGRIAQAGVSRLAMQQAGPLGNESTTSTTFTDLATFGPSVQVTLTSARRALVWISASARVANNVGYFGVQVDGPIHQDPQSDGFLSNLNAAFVEGIITVPLFFDQFLLPSPGTYTFTMKYRVNVNTSSVFFNQRRIIVYPF